MIKAKPGISITFLPQDKIVYTSHKDSTVIEAALKAGVKISNSCGGNGTCGTCLVIVKEGLEHLPARNEIEAEIAQDRNLDVNERLCCQIESPTLALVLLIPGAPSK